jgi:putative heme iron utilization protein
MNETRSSPIRATDDEARLIAKTLLRATRTGALATLEASSGHPFASLTTVATDTDGTPLILVSRLSGHTGNLMADPRASLLLSRAGKGDPLAHPRITLIVAARAIARESAAGQRARGRFLARHPKAALYVDFPDFGFFALEIARASLNGGFGKAYELTPADILTDLSGAAELTAAEEGAVAHMNADHADAVQLYATKLLGAPDGAWQITGIDPDGVDLACGDMVERLFFPKPVTTATALRQSLVELAQQARATA